MMAIRNAFSRMTGRRGCVPGPADVLVHASLAKSLIDDLSGRLGQPCHLLDFHATRTGSLTLRIRADRFYIAKLPLRTSTEPRLRQNAETLKALGQLSWVTPFLSARFPALVLQGTASGRFYSVETTVPGQDGASIFRTGGRADEMILAAEHFLCKFQKASTQVERSAWEGPFESAVERVQTLAKRAGCAQHYDQLVADVRTRLSAQQIQTVCSHGNFWLGNVLFDSANNLTGVIDWDCTAAFMLPALDLIYLLVRTHGLARSASYGEALADWIDARSLPFLDDCIVRHCRELSVPSKLIAPLSYCSWIQHLDSHARYGTSTSTDPRWLRRNVRHVLQRWRLRTAAGRWEVRRWDMVN